MLKNASPYISLFTLKTIIFVLLYGFTSASPVQNAVPKPQPKQEPEVESEHGTIPPEPRINPYRITIPPLPPSGSEESTTDSDDARLDDSKLEQEKFDYKIEQPQSRKNLNRKINAKKLWNIENDVSANAKDFNNVFYQREQHPREAKKVKREISKLQKIINDENMDVNDLWNMVNPYDMGGRPPPGKTERKKRKTVEMNKDFTIRDENSVTISLNAYQKKEKKILRFKRELDSDGLEGNMMSELLHPRIPLKKHARNTTFSSKELTSQSDEYPNHHPTLESLIDYDDSKVRRMFVNDSTGEYVESDEGERDYLLGTMTTRDDPLREIILFSKVKYTTTLFPPINNETEPFYFCSNSSAIEEDVYTLSPPPLDGTTNLLQRQMYEEVDYYDDFVTETLNKRPKIDNHKKTAFKEWMSKVVPEHAHHLDTLHGKELEELMHQKPHGMKKTYGELFHEHNEQPQPENKVLHEGHHFEQNSHKNQERAENIRYLIHPEHNERRLQPEHAKHELHVEHALHPEHAEHALHPGNAEHVLYNEHSKHALHPEHAKHILHPEHAKHVLHPEHAKHVLHSEHALYPEHAEHPEHDLHAKDAEHELNPENELHAELMEHYARKEHAENEEKIRKENVAEKIIKNEHEPENPRKSLLEEHYLRDEPQKEIENEIPHDHELEAEEAPQTQAPQVQAQQQQQQYQQQQQQQLYQQQMYQQQQQNQYGNNYNNYGGGAGGGMNGMGMNGMGGMGGMNGMGGMGGMNGMGMNGMGMNGMGMNGMGMGQMGGVGAIINAIGNNLPKLSQQPQQGQAQQNPQQNYPQQNYNQNYPQGSPPGPDPNAPDPNVQNIQDAAAAQEKAAQQQEAQVQQPDTQDSTAIQDGQDTDASQDEDSSAKPDVDGSESSAIRADHSGDDVKAMQPDDDQLPSEDTLTNQLDTEQNPQLDNMQLGQLGLDNGQNSLPLAAAAGG